MTYLTFDQVLLVEDKNRLKGNEPVVYERQYGPNRVLTLDGKPSKYATEAKPYGRMYFDTKNNPCVVPDQWDEIDAFVAKDYQPLN